MQTSSYHLLTENLIELFTDHADPEKARAMSAYMKNQFLFIGLPKPVRSKLQKSFLTMARSEPIETIHELAQLLWSLPEREYQYVAMELLMAAKRKWNQESLSLFEKLVLQKSWWDTVDLIASKMIGVFCRKEHGRYKKLFLDYAANDNIWLNRVAIIHQLTYKPATDMTLFEEIFLRCGHKKEFFIQKAIGWALRQYSGIDPKAVIRFTEMHALSSLARREALRKL
jgi:3-methyladenine DNA glycosylase AlkD